jgi:hypothetical protein
VVPGTLEVEIGGLLSKALSDKKNKLKAKGLGVWLKCRVLV